MWKKKETRKKKIFTNFPIQTGNVPFSAPRIQTPFQFPSGPMKRDSEKFARFRNDSIHLAGATYKSYALRAPRLVNSVEANGGFRPCEAPVAIYDP
ncbi:hypothetical protein NPIL_208331 [Nephila pilipes]|uniref:Uncharacterized protein n=1 Tax=Nephila pilipes TaxID=299642 RepID=A0A8X6TKB8_NEPPI|nr:hypothetical protein NPIL_208331 [Nephila pilipes]